MTRTRRLSLFAAAAAIIALSTFTTAAPVPAHGNQLGLFGEDLDILPPFSSLKETEAPNHNCGHDESDYENDNEDESDDDDDDDESDEYDDQEGDDGETEESEEATEEDLQAAGEADDYYVGQTYTGLIFDSTTGETIALSTVDTDQDMLELALFLRRKKVTSFEEIWNDAEEKDSLEYEDEKESFVESDVDALLDMINYGKEGDEEEEEDVFESET